MNDCYCTQCAWEGGHDDLTPCCGKCPVCGGITEDTKDDGVSNDDYLKQQRREVPE